MRDDVKIGEKRTYDRKETLIEDNVSVIPKKKSGLNWAI